MTSDLDHAVPATRITLIRHGESNVTVQRIIGGRRTCTGLSELGRRQAERLADRLAAAGDVEPDVLLASDFPRAIETAEIIRSALGEKVAGPISSWSSFGEHDPGPDIDGMSFAAYVERFGRPDWSGDPYAVFFPGGETIADFHERVARALDDVMQHFAGRHVVVACHGGVIDAVFRLLLRQSPTGGFVIESRNTAITEFSGPVRMPGRSSSPAADQRAWLTGDWRVERVNDAAHLAGLPAATERTDGLASAETS